MAAVAERLYKITADASQAVRELQKLNKSTGSIDKNFSSMQRAATLATKAVASVGAAMGAFTAVKGITDVANQINLLQASFGALTGDAQRGADMISRAFGLVEETGAGFEDVSTSLQRLTIGMQDLGANNEQIEGVAEAFIKIGRIGGTSMFSTNQALVQFTQGLASGRLQGDELRSILERVPLITSLIAKEMGVTRGEIKELGKEGKVTADIMVNALLKALPDIRKDFETLPQISEQAMNRISAQWDLLQKSFAEETGLDTSFVAGLESVADGLTVARTGLENFFDAVRTMGKDLTGAFDAFQTTGGIPAAILNTTVLAGGLAAALLLVYKNVGLIEKAFKILTATNPMVLALTAVAAAAALVIKNWDEIRIFFAYQMPQFIAKGEIVWYEFADAVGKVWNDIKNAAFESFNGIILEYQKVAAVLRASGFQVPWISTFGEGAEYVSQFSENIKQANDTIALFEGKYVTALAEVNAKAKEAGDALDEATKPRTVTVATKLDIEKITTDLDKLYEKIDPVTKIFNTFSAQILTLQQALNAKLIDQEEYDRLLQIFDDMKDKALDAVDPTTKLKEKLGELFDTVDPSRAPIREFAEGIQLLNDALADPDIDLSAAQYAKVAEALAKVRDEAIAGQDAATNMLAKIKDAVDGFGRDFAKEIVAGVKEGKLAFEDLASGILETIAEIMLTEIFTNFFSMISGSLFGGVGGSTGGGSGFGTFGGLVAAPVTAGVTPFGAAAGQRMNVGMLTGPTYGDSMSSSAGVNVTVNNNAPVEVTVEQRKVRDRVDLEIMIEEKVKQSISGGGLDRVMNASYGTNRRAF